MAERTWEGAKLKIGSAVIGVRDLRQRCIMTTFDPDTMEQDTSVLRRIHREFGGTMALNCYVTLFSLAFCLGSFRMFTPVPPFGGRGSLEVVVTGVYPFR